jgi:CubicO group peptidase (beta-lactamase class C family)
MRRYFAVSLALTSLAILCGCGGDDFGDSNGSPREENPGLPPMISLAPEATSDGWRTSTPGAEGMDETLLRATLQSIRDGAYPRVDSIVIARNNVLIAEAYYNGYGRDTLHDVRSTSKSITSALAGIAIEQGLFGVDDPIAQLVPQFDSYANIDARKQAITVFHLLNMTSGLTCNDWDPSSRGNEEKMYDSRDWVRFILDLPMAYDPGVAPSYCSGGLVVLGSIIATRSGVPLDNFANTWLFNPLGIQDLRWRRSPDDRATGGGGMHLRPRDMAKFGNLFVNGGRWNGVPVISEQWIEQSMRRVTTLGSDGYGFNWWKRGFQVGGATEVSTFAWGNGGNFIFLFPAQQLVVVFTGSNYNSAQMDPPFGILSGGVLPAVR